MSDHDRKKCLACDSGPDQAPLISFEFRGGVYTICSRHFPLLIHSPHRLAGKLPGAETIEGSEHHD